MKNEDSNRMIQKLPREIPIVERKLNLGKGKYALIFSIALKKSILT